MVALHVSRVPGLVNFGLQTHEIHVSYYCFFFEMAWVNSLGHVLFPFARWQHDHAQTPLPCETSVTRAWAVWQAVVDVPPSLQRVVELLHHVVDIVQSMQTFYNAL